MTFEHPVVTLTTATHDFHDARAYSEWRNCRVRLMFVCEISGQQVEDPEMGTLIFDSGMFVGKAALVEVGA